MGAVDIKPLWTLLHCHLLIAEHFHSNGYCRDASDVTLYVVVEAITVLFFRKLIWLQYRRSSCWSCFLNPSVKVTVENCFYSQLQCLSWEWVLCRQTLFQFCEVTAIGAVNKLLFERWLAVISSFEFLEHCCCYSFACQAVSEDVRKFWTWRNCDLQLVKRLVKTSSVHRCLKHSPAGWHRLRSVASHVTTSTILCPGAERYPEVASWVISSLIISYYYLSTAPN